MVADVDARRDGRVVERIGHYNPRTEPMDYRIHEDRALYWLSVGAQPSEKVKVLIDKYGTNGTHLEQQRQALERVKLNKPTAPPPRAVPKPKPEEPKVEEEQVAEQPAPEDQAETAAEAAAADEGNAAGESGE